MIIELEYADKPPVQFHEDTLGYITIPASALEGVTKTTILGGGELLLGFGKTLHEIRRWSLCGSVYDTQTRTSQSVEIPITEDMVDAYGNVAINQVVDPNRWRGGRGE